MSPPLYPGKGANLLGVSATAAMLLGASVGSYGRSNGSKISHM